MTSKVDIINLALGKLAQDVGIAAITDQSKPARVFGRLWAPMRDIVLAARAWPWAMKAERLALETQTPLPGWQYRYARPEDCITAVAVTDEYGLRSVRRMGGWCDHAVRQRYGHEFDSAYGDQGTSLVSDLPDAYLVYVARVEDSERYPPHFVDALACKLAEEGAAPIIGDAGMNARQSLKQLYMLAISEAAAHDFNESTESIETPSPSLEARW